MVLITLVTLNERIDLLEFHILSLSSSKVLVKKSSGFHLFAQSIRQDVRSSLFHHTHHLYFHPTHKHIMKEIAITWNLLSTEEKYHWKLHALT
jgi:hypothetical protein